MPDASRPSHRRRRLVTALLVLAVVAGGWIAFTRWPRSPTRSVEAFCRQLSSVQDFDRALGGLDAAAVKDTLPRLTQLRQVSPPDIEPQVGVVVDVSRDLAGAVDRAQTDDGKAVEDVWRARLGDLPRIEAAGRSLQDYARANCQIDLTTAVAPPTSASVPGG